MELQFGCANRVQSVQKLWVKALLPALNISATGLWRPVPCKVLPTPRPTANRSIWEAAAGLETISEESSSSSCNLQREASRLSTITWASSKACIQIWHITERHICFGGSILLQFTTIRQDFAYNPAEWQLGWILELCLDAKWFWISRPVEPGLAEVHQETSLKQLLQRVEKTCEDLRSE